MASGKVFTLTCKFPNDCEHETFSVSCVLKNNGTIIGIEDKSKGKYPFFIKGIFVDKKLAFIRVSNEIGVNPEIFLFDNVTEEGFWDKHSLFNGFFKEGHYVGTVRILIYEKVDICEAMRISTMYQKEKEKSCGMKKIMVASTKDYLNSLLDE